MPHRFSSQKIEIDHRGMFKAQMKTLQHLDFINYNTQKERFAPFVYNLQTLVSSGVSFSNETRDCITMWLR
jgi:hypothetical protein